MSKSRVCVEYISCVHIVCIAIHMHNTTYYFAYIVIHSLHISYEHSTLHKNLLFSKNLYLPKLYIRSGHDDIYFLLCNSSIRCLFREVIRFWRFVICCLVWVLLSTVAVEVDLLLIASARFTFT